jgi:hypothetical protein
LKDQTRIDPSKFIRKIKNTGLNFGESKNKMIMIIWGRHKKRWQAYQREHKNKQTRMNKSDSQTS